MLFMCGKMEHFYLKKMRKMIESVFMRNELRTTAGFLMEERDVDLLLKVPNDQDQK